MFAKCRSIFALFKKEGLSFVSSQSGPASLPAEDISTNTNGPRQESLFDDDPEDLFAGKLSLSRSFAGLHKQCLWLFL